MYWLRRILLWLPANRRARERELNEELNANLSLALAEADDERAARRDFGSITRAREEARAVWFPGWDSLSQDVRFAVRTLRRSPGFTIVALLSLGLGSGAATALFSLVDTIVLKPLAYRESGRLMFIREVVPPLAHIYPSLPVNFQHFRFWQQQSQAFESIAGFRGDSATIYSGGEPEVVGGISTSANLFTTLGVQAQIGRLFDPGDDQPGKPEVVVITDGLWRRRFGGSPDILGRTIRLNGTQYSVIGVLPASFRFPRKGDLGALANLSEQSDFYVPVKDALEGWGGDYDYSIFGRLKSGVSAGEGTAELNLLEKRISLEHQLNSGLHVQARLLQEVIGTPVRTALVVLLAAVLMLLLIVCVNLANLLLARGNARAREYSLRLAIGASRGRLLSSALVEALILAGAGGLIGLFVAQVALRLFIQHSPIGLPRLDEVGLDGRIAAFTFGLSLLCGLLFGVLPALRLSSADPQDALRSGSHTATGSRRGIRLREWLVGAEVSLSTVLLVLAGLLVSSLWHVLHVDRGFRADQSLEVRVSLPPGYGEVADRDRFFEQACERLRTLPGVRSVAAASKVPLTGESNVNPVGIDGAEPGALDPATRELIMLNVRFVGPEYFKSLGIPLLRGRAIEDGDSQRNVVVISGRLAAKLWPGQNPIGRTLSTGSRVMRSEVVGVVGDVHTTTLDRDPTLIVYAPYWKFSYQVSGFVVRVASGAAATSSDIRRVLQSLDPEIPAPKIRTMGEIVDESVVGRRFQMNVVVAFAFAALLLAALGIYGVVAYSVTLRRRELGIRIALGAQAAQLTRLVIWQGFRPVAYGLLCGVAAALAAGRLVRTLLFGVSANDGWTLGAITLILALVSLLACLLPSRAALRIQPAGVLRQE